MAQLPNLRFIASVRTQGIYDYVDVLEVDPGREPADAIVAAFQGGDGLEVEALPGAASTTLRAPGAPGAPGA